MELKNRIADQPGRGNLAEGCPKGQLHNYRCCLCHKITTKLRIENGISKGLGKSTPSITP